MRVLFVGTLPPPEGVAAFRFGQYAGLRAIGGENVVTHSPHPLSVAHQNLRLGPNSLARHLQHQAPSFDAVVLRVGEGLPLSRHPLLGHAISQLVHALERFSEVTLFVDPGIGAVDRLVGPAMRPLWSAAHVVIVADASDERLLIERTGVSPSKIQVLEAGKVVAATSTQWPSAEVMPLAPASADAIRKRSQARSSSPSLLAQDTGTARPSFTGATVWLIRRVIGKTRGWVTKLLRP